MQRAKDTIEHWERGKYCSSTDEEEEEKGSAVRALF
jgi:hypothetical protein